MSTQPGVCNFCGTGCGHLLDVGNGAVRGVFAWPGHPVSRGRLCVRGWHIHELLATKDRLTVPAVRRDGRLQAAAYDEALAFAADRLARYSGDEIAFLASPRASNEDNFLMAQLARSVFRTPHIALASDQGHGEAADVLLEGTGWPAMSGGLTEIRKAGFILVAGADIATVPYEVLMKSLRHPLTDVGLERFLAEEANEDNRHLNDFFVEVRPEFAVVGPAQEGQEQPA